jgi:hypothetical protein
MAKKDDDDVIHEEAREPEEAERSEEAEKAEESAEAEEPAESAAEPPEDGDESAEEPKPRRPRPQVTGLTLALCILNVLAAVAFIFLLLMNYSKRQAWSYAVFRDDLALMGLPLEEEADAPSAARVTFPRHKLEPEQLKTAFTQRGGQAREPFQATELVISHPILGQHLNEDILKDLFKGMGEPVKTLQEEVQRVKKSLAGDIAQAAQEAAATAKTDNDKRQKIERYLFALAISPAQVEALDKKIKQLPAAKLDAALQDVAQRRMLAEILLPLERIRPAELKDRLLEKIADFDSVPLERFTDLLTRRIDETTAGTYDPTLHFGTDWANEKRDSIDKRQAIAFFLFTVSQAKKLDGTPLPTEPADRLQAVVGLYEYALAVQKLTVALVDRYDRTLEDIRNDRDGSLYVSKGKAERVGGFIDPYRAEVKRLHTLASDIKWNQGRLADLKKQIEGHKTIIKDRQELIKSITDKLVKERETTAKLAAELKKLQDQLFEAQLRLRDAQRENLRREAEIRRWESLTTKKGAAQ